jgi:cell division protein FtsB
MRVLKTTLPIVMLALAIMYFSYHALAGDQGLAQWTRLQAEQKVLQAKIDALRGEREVLQRHVARLRDESLDLDYIEELARTKLSYARRDEMLVAAR